MRGNKFDLEAINLWCMFFYSKNFVSLPSRSVGNHRGNKMGTDVYEFMNARCIFRVDISGYDRDILFIKKSRGHTFCAHFRYE